MTLEDDYRTAMQHLREINELGSKVTAQARHRIAAHTLRGQLEAHLQELRAEFGDDQDDILTAFSADQSWSGQHARLNKGWDTTSIEP